MIEARLSLRRGDFELDVGLRGPARGVTALFGPSGCGKTTLLRALAGLERARGRVAIGGEVWQDDASGRFVPTSRRALGMVIQEAALFPHLSVRANLEYGRRRSGAPALGPEVLELLAIGALLDRTPGTLSGGERQRVAIARALATRPAVLLMDEPLAALDAARKAELLPHLEQLARAGGTPIVYVTHALDEVVRLADHLVLMRDGRVEAAGGVVELLGDAERAPGRADEVGVIVEATVAEIDAAYGLARVDFRGGSLWLPSAAAVGARVRARVLARDVSLARRLPEQTSILNVLPTVVRGLHGEGTSILVALAVDAGDGPAGPQLLARITRRSRDALGLQVGERVYAQVKSVALA